MWFLNLIKNLVFFFGISNIYLPYFNAGKIGMIHSVNAADYQCNYGNSLTSNVLKFILRKYRSKFMSTGLPEIKLPSMEPLKIEELNFQTRHPEVITLDLQLRNLTVNELTTFKIDSACMFSSGQKIIINLSIPKIVAKGFYNISGLIGNMYLIEGFGPMTFTLNNFQISASLFINLGSPLSLEQFDIDFSIKSADSNLENLYDKQNVSLIMNQVISDIFPEAIVKLKPEILPKIQELIAGSLNNTLRTISNSELTKLIFKFTSIF